MKLISFLQNRIMRRNELFLSKNFISLCQKIIFFKLNYASICQRKNHYRKKRFLQKKQYSNKTIKMMKIIIKTISKIL